MTDPWARAEVRAQGAGNFPSASGYISISIPKNSPTAQLEISPFAQ